MSDSESDDEGGFYPAFGYRLLDTSTRCDGDFRWIASETKSRKRPPAYAPSPARRERDRKTRSAHNLPGGRRSRSREEFDLRDIYCRVSRDDPSPRRRQRCCSGCCRRPPSPPRCPCCRADRCGYRTPCGFESPESAEDRVRRLESDKDSLRLQVAVLSEQIAAQSEKIDDLERALSEKRTLLSRADDLLQRETMTRSSLETQKLELMSAVSEARLRQAALERENRELRAARSSLSVSNGSLRRRSPSPVEVSAPRTPPASYRRLTSDPSPHSFSSLPRGASMSTSCGSNASPGPRLSRPSPSSPSEGSAVRFGKVSQQHCMVVARGRGRSVPDLAERDTVIGCSSPASGSSKTGGGSKGWAGLLGVGGKGDGALEDVDDDDRGDSFRRGGTRATAAPRLQTAPYAARRWSTLPPKDWDADVTCEWLEWAGLECYTSDAKKWLTNPAGNRGILASAAPQQIEKELGIKNPLHKKKIVLALLDMQGKSCDPLLKPAGRLDAAWALRWLEDAGLPQYREAWAAATADGRVLHRLSHDDLQLLKVTSQLHTLSIRRGIQVLRENDFSPDTMIRRATDAETSHRETVGDGDGEGELEEREREMDVARWSSHRVMEWLRAVDLAEYAPNLRGAGVHGGLMCYESRFTGELLAALLNIPPGKTLLRRHLTTRFNQLLGKDVIHHKREAQQTLGYQPLTLASKVKVAKKGQFTLKRKKNKGELDCEDLVCPIADMAGEALSITKPEASGEEAAACRATEELSVSRSADSPLSQRSENAVS